MLQYRLGRVGLLPGRKEQSKAPTASILHAKLLLFPRLRRTKKKRERKKEKQRGPFACLYTLCHEYKTKSSADAVEDMTFIQRTL